MTYTDDVTYVVFVAVQPIYMNDVVLLFLFLFRKIKFLGLVTRSYEEVLPLYRGPGTSVGIATDYGLDGPGSNPGGDEIFREVTRKYFLFIVGRVAQSV